MVPKTFLESKCGRKARVLQEEEEEEGEENFRYGLLWIGMDFWTFVRILVCSISSV